jgi:hypothetical protein
MSSDIHHPLDGVVMQQSQECSDRMVAMTDGIDSRSTFGYRDHLALSIDHLTGVVVLALLVHWEAR